MIWVNQRLRVVNVSIFSPFLDELEGLVSLGCPDLCVEVWISYISRRKIFGPPMQMLLSFYIVI